MKLSLEIGTGENSVLAVAVEFAGLSDEGRGKWLSTLSIDGKQVASDDQLQSPSTNGGAIQPWRALESLVGFLDAWAEAVAYDERGSFDRSENGDLFGDEWRPVLDHTEELSYLTRWPDAD